MFFPLAFYGIVPDNELWWLIVSKVILKTLYEIIALPATIRVVKFTKKFENEDAYDTAEKYSIFKFFN